VEHINGEDQSADFRTMLHSSSIDNQLWDGNGHEKNIIKRGSVTFFKFPRIIDHTIMYYVFYSTYFTIFYHASTLMHAHHVHEYKYVRCLTWQTWDLTMTEDRDKVRQMI